MLGWAYEEPWSILNAIDSMSFFRKGDGLSEMICSKIVGCKVGTGQQLWRAAFQKAHVAGVR